MRSAIINIPIKAERAYPKANKWVTLILISLLILIAAIIGFSLALQLVGSLQVNPIF